MFILLFITALLQGIPIAPQASGTVSGVLKTVDGKPAAGVRVSAMTRQEPLQATAAVALASIAETDENGRYTIEGIPPGQYYIVAGSIDRPTYFPGTQDITSARVVQITAGARIAGFDFAVIDTSRRAISTRLGPSWLQVSLRVTAERGSRMPAVSPAGPLTLEFERAPDRITASAPATATQILLELQPAGTATEYRARIRNLPEGFFVSSMTYAGVDLRSGILSLPAAAALSSSLGMVAAGDTLVVTIGEGARVRTGVRVTGIGRRSDSHPVVLSGNRGLVFSDGSFEFYDVPPGLHTIALIDSPGRALGTTIVVGDQDIDGVFLDEIAALPLNIQSPVPPAPAGDAAAGTKLPPVVLRGTVIDRMTRQPPPSGQIWISGRSSPSYALDAEGNFEIMGLLPGTYKLELQVAGYATVTRDLIVDVQNLRLDLEIEK